MKRLYYLTDTLDSTEQISQDVHKSGVTDWNFHVHSEDQAGLTKRHIHRANFLQNLEVVGYGERGAMLGFICACFVAGALAVLQPFSEPITGLGYAAIFAFITAFGTWAGGLAGICSENRKITEFHDDVHKGKYLILIDAGRKQAEEVKQLMSRLHPEALFKREGSTWINPFTPNSAI
ncbi:MAG: hypothetical protein V3V31_11160 [Methylococcales bacterium]